MATSNVALWQTAIDGFVQLIELMGQSAELQNRDMKASGFDANFDEVFTKFSDVILAFDTDENGKTIFDSVSVEQSVTGEAYMEFEEGVTSELWVLYNNRRIKIVDVENIGELNGILKLTLQEKGDSSLESTKA